MALDVTTVWQVGAGDADRNYADICLRWGVILNGPGDEGPWPKVAKHLTSRKTSDLRRFCEDIKEGQLVVLKVGKSSIYGIGRVAGNYEWNDHFGDIDGWDIQHVRRIKWIWKCEDRPYELKNDLLKWGDTTQRLGSPEALRFVEAQLARYGAESHPLRLLEHASEPLNEIQPSAIADFLFDQGISANSIDRLNNEIGELQRIARWYDRADEAPSEHETVAYLVVPLLRSLGWTPQKMALEWNRVDIALFTRTPRENKNLIGILEAKRRYQSCLRAFDQAERYARLGENSGCNRLILTDGIRYAVYKRPSKGEFDRQPHAYLNLTRMMEKYPILRCLGARDAILAMSADWANADLTADAESQRNLE